ncbi:hypothetical protein [Pedobacter nutrimenti]|uniref:hypothetical protein n=1 Tax=Pedobacter nutrimenti TaxID=1241337 RepID=UPI00292F4CCC|nr:hypothetical protein [Pedobacter nutrimenti]
MIYKRLFSIGVCFIVSVLVIVMLFVSSDYLRNRPNSFVRLLPPHKIIPGPILDLTTSGYYFAGFNKDKIYMGNFFIPNSILSIRSNMKDSIRLQLHFSRQASLLKGSFSIIEDSSVFVLDGNQPALFIGNLLSDSELKGSHPPFFNKAVHIDKRSFVLRAVINGNNVLIKYKSDSTGFKFGNTALKKQVDGIFCTDGNLVKTRDSKLLFYIYYYRNQFLCSDTNLKLMYAGKTIDTNTHAKIKVSYLRSSNQITLSAPPIYVNKQAAANNKFLFIVSGLKADNEKYSLLDEFSIIDVYAVSNGKYQFSFYLPNFNGKKLTDFRVDEQSLYALYDHYLYKYQLNF